MAHRAEIIYFIRFGLLHDPYQVGAVGQVTVMQTKMNIFFMRILVKMIHAVRIEKRTPSFNSVNLVSLGQQKFTEIGAILTSHARNQCNF